MSSCLILLQVLLNQIELDFKYVNAHVRAFVGVGEREREHAILFNLVELAKGLGKQIKSTVSFRKTARLLLKDA